MYIHSINSDSLIFSVEFLEFYDKNYIGKYKGRKLQEVPNLYVRPTQAVVRKSMMEILGPFKDLSVLDLYAGVGTLGIEAMSRGANFMTFVEYNKEVFTVLKKY